MPNTVDSGFILRKTPYSESSFILKAYTREHGLLSFMAKGAKRQNSRLHGLLEPGLHLQFLFPVHARGELRILSDVTLLRDHPSVRGDLVKHALAQAFGEVLLKYLPDEARAPDFHDALARALQRLEASPPERRAVEACFAAWLLDFCRASGFQPQFRFCVRCDARVEGATVAFALDRGGPVCARCGDAHAARAARHDEGGIVRLRAAAWRWLVFLDEGAPGVLPPAATDGAADADAGAEIPALHWSDARQAEDFLLQYVGSHAGGEKRLKAVSVWRSLMDA